MTDDTVMILKRVACGGIRQTEDELRYQLKRDGHPLADDGQLIFRIAELERAGLLLTHMSFTLTDAGRERLTTTGEVT